MNRNELISIVIPVYNVEDYLDKCLNSIVNQTYKNIEIIIVNDGSTDNSEKIIKEYIKKDKRIIYHKKSNGGLSSARNVGIKIATGKYICFIDSDDWISDKYIELLYLSLKENDGDIAICNIESVYKDGTLKKVSYKIKENEILSSRQALCELFIGKKIQNHTVNKLYKTSLFKDNNIFFPINRIYEDVFTTYRLFLKSERINVIKDNLYFYLQQREGSILNSKFNEKRFDLLDAIDEMSLNKELKRFDLYKEFQVFYVKQLTGLFNYISVDYSIKKIQYFNSIFRRIKKHPTSLIKKKYLSNDNINKTLKIKFTLMYYCPNIYCVIKKIYIKVLKKD